MTEADIVEAVREAMETLKRLPGGRPGGYRGYWPDTLRDTNEVFSNAVKAGRYEDMKVRPGPPNKEQIDALDIFGEWMLMLTGAERIAITGKSVGAPDRKLGRQMAKSQNRAKPYSRYTVRRYHLAAVRKILKACNGSNTLVV